MLMNNLWKQFLTIIFLSVALWGMSTLRAHAAPSHINQQKGNRPTPEELINAVNDARLANGVPALSPHPALMQIAQWGADAIASGAPGHSRPPGLTLGQWMISLGYPLAGSISRDGYRSENWVSGTGLTVPEAIELWFGDDPHTNTMLSPNRSDIGAGVAVSEDVLGNKVYHYVIETALQTPNGEQQPEALEILAAMSQAAEALLVPQYIIPVSLATARPDGDVIHEVKYGQSLWSISVAYGVKIINIERLNNLTPNDEIWTNQELLVQKGATQPAPVFTETATREPQDTSTPPAPTITSTATKEVEVEITESSQGVISTLALFLIVAGLVTGLLLLLLLHDLKQKNNT
jgi:uncharacterized protein YkwD